MTSKKKALSGSRLYLILDKTACGRRDTKTVLSQAAAGGVDMVQFRDKSSSTKAMIREGRVLLDLARKNGIPFIVNDRLDVCIALDADGIHLGQDDMPPADARKILGPHKTIGLSCHSAEDVKRANDEDVDYIGFGPVFATPTKPAVAPVGPASLKNAWQVSKHPVFAIGGISSETFSLLPESSDLRIAVCREICAGDRVTEKTQHLKKILLHV